MGLAKPRGARDYRGTINGLDNVEIAYLSASEIASQLARGAVHLGVTGEDLVRESIVDADKRVLLIDSLGFGSANVVVAVPQAWIDVRTMADLDDVTTGFRAQHNRRMRVATKYINLTRSFFAAHGVVDYRIVESAGATEGAPAVGTAEMIVDITTTGATLAANGLKVLDDGVILRSQANLVASRDADWSDEARETARVILDHIAARARASKYREVRTRFAGCNAALLTEAHNRFGVVSPFGGPTSSGNGDAALPAVAALRARQLSSRSRRRHGVGGLARLCARPRQSAVCQARGIPAALRQTVAARSVATSRDDCHNVVSSDG